MYGEMATGGTVGGGWSGGEVPPVLTRRRFLAAGAGGAVALTGLRSLPAVAQTDPGLQGDRSTGGTKPATLETGASIQVPLFVGTGEKVKVDTRDGRYLGRVSS